MLIVINRISWNVALDGGPHLRTLTLLSWEGIHSRTTLLDSYDQNSPPYSLARTPMTVFARPQTTSYPWIGPPAQYLHIDIYHLAYHPYKCIFFSSLFLFTYFENLNITNCSWAKWSHEPILIQFRRNYWTNLFFYFVLYLVEFQRQW